MINFAYFFILIFFNLFLKNECGGNILIFKDYVNKTINTFLILDIFKGSFVIENNKGN